MKSQAEFEMDENGSFPQEACRLLLSTIQSTELCDEDTKASKSSYIYLCIATRALDRGLAVVSEGRGRGGGVRTDWELDETASLNMPTAWTDGIGQGSV